MKDRYGIPSLKNIEALYNEVIPIPLLEQLETKADIIEFGKKHHVIMEINCDFAEIYDESEPIEVISCEFWGDLTYICVCKDGSKPKFSVWSNFYDSEFIEGITIDELNEGYKSGIRTLWYVSEDRPGDLEEIILTLYDQGMSINDIFED